MFFEGFQQRLMEQYKKGQHKSLMESLTNMMVEGTAALCNRCQSDRLVCALRPLCGDRRYVNLLVEMGATEDEIKLSHQYCYSSHISALKNMRENGDPITSLKDAKYSLPTFMRTIVGDFDRTLSSLNILLEKPDAEKLSQVQTYLGAHMG